MKKLQGVQKLIATGTIVGCAAGGLFAVGGVVAGAQAQQVEFASVSDDRRHEMTPAEFMASQNADAEIARGSTPATTPSTQPAAASSTTTAPPATTSTAPSTTAAPTTTTAAPSTTAPPAPTTTAAPATTAPTTAAPTTTTTAPRATSPEAGTFDPACETRLVELMNAERADAGMGSITHDVRGQRVARRWTNHMKTTSKLAHNPKFGEDLTAEGIRWSGAAENVAYNYTPDDTHRALMASPGHRANIMNPDYTGVGVGCSYDDDGVLWVTQNFWY